MKDFKEFKEDLKIKLFNEFEENKSKFYIRIFVCFRVDGLEGRYIIFEFL